MNTRQLFFGEIPLFSFTLWAILCVADGRSLLLTEPGAAGEEEEPAAGAEEEEPAAGAEEEEEPAAGSEEEEADEGSRCARRTKRSLICFALERFLWSA